MELRTILQKEIKLNVNCEEIKRLINQSDLQCCISCHEDDDMGYEDALLDIYDKNDRFIGQVCCKVANAYDKFKEKEVR